MVGVSECLVCGLFMYTTIEAIFVPAVSSKLATDPLGLLSISR